MLFSQQILELIRNGIGETLCMVIISTIVSYMIGIPLGIILVVTDKEGIRPIPALQKGGNQPGLEGSGTAAGGVCSTLHCPHGRILL